MVFISFCPCPVDRSIARASIIAPETKKATNGIDHQFTAFVPPDAILFPMPSYAQDVLFFNTTLLNYVIISSHVITDISQLLFHIHNRHLANVIPHSHSQPIVFWGVFGYVFFLAKKN